MIKKINRKTMTIRASSRSSDFISPSFGFGCLFNCTYCYMKRHKPTGLEVAQNISEILTEIDSHVWFTDIEKPNQTHEEYTTYDISCNEDFALHAKYYDWKLIFGFFRDHRKAMATFATKYVNKTLLDFNPNGKVRIRFSLMPENIREIVEPNTSTIMERLDAVKLFQAAGYDVHLNFSPVIVYDKWIDDYKKLFTQVRNIAIRDNWHEANALYPDRPVKAEVIFLTHNHTKHNYNTIKKLPGENLLWTPDQQEGKISTFGGDNIRYKTPLKKGYINKFKVLHDYIIPWNEIRYIF